MIPQTATLYLRNSTTPNTSIPQERVSILKPAFIYAPIRQIRIGGAFHSPTWFTLNDDYYTNLNYSYDDGESQYYSNRSPDGSFKYKLKAPARVVGSLGTIYKLGPIQGFINGDVEWVDYNNNRFDFYLLFR